MDERNIRILASLPCLLSCLRTWLVLTHYSYTCEGSGPITKCFLFFSHPETCYRTLRGSYFSLRLTLLFIILCFIVFEKQRH